MIHFLILHRGHRTYALNLEHVVDISSLPDDDGTRFTLVTGDDVERVCDEKFETILKYLKSIRSTQIYKDPFA